MGIGYAHEESGIFVGLPTLKGPCEEQKVLLRKKKGFLVNPTIIKAHGQERALDTD